MKYYIRNIVLLIALSTLSSAFADNEKYDGRNVSGQHFEGFSSHNYSS